MEPYVRCPENQQNQSNDTKCARFPNPTFVRHPIHLMSLGKLFPSTLTTFVDFPLMFCENIKLSSLCVK